MNIWLDDEDFIDITALGFPADVTTEELKKRLSFAKDNDKQLQRYMSAVRREILKRGG
jgi:hypothetical protein